MIYVDNAQHAYRRMIMCHMIADSPAELHEMARNMGVQRKWFQAKASVPHYDVCFSMRAKAITLGAKLVHRRELVAIIKRIRSQWSHNAAGDWL